MAMNTTKRRPGRHEEIEKGKLNQLAAAYFGGGANLGSLLGDAAGATALTNEGPGGIAEGLDEGTGEGGGVVTPTALGADQPGTLPPPPYKKLKWWEHALNVPMKGAISQQANAYNQNLDMAAYQGQLRSIQGQQAAASAMERAKAVQAAMDAREAAAFQNKLKEIEAQEGMKRRELMLQDSNAQAQAEKNMMTKAGYPDRPRYEQFHMPAVIAASTSAIRKPELENLELEANIGKTRADTDMTRAKIPVESLLRLGAGDAGINPTTREVFRNAPALMDEPYKMGGVTSSFLGGGRVVPKVNAGMSLAPQPADVTTEQELAQPSIPSGIYAPDGGKQDINPTALNQIIEMFSSGFNPNRRKAFPGRY